jgi:Fe-S-cluster containining protein
MNDRVAIPWWSGGLCFSCTRCGGCCGGAPGTVSFTYAEEEAMAMALGLDVFSFRVQYVWDKYGFPSLREKENYDCIFLTREPLGCKIYENRPSQCSSFPFWPAVLKSRRSWERFARDCPGMNQGDFHDSRSIMSRLWRTASSL